MTSRRDSARVLALTAALTPVSAKARGAAPSEAELVALCEGRLDASRRDEILSHLASSREQFAKWMRAGDATTENFAATGSERGVAAKTASLRDRLDVVSKRWIGFALAAGIAAIVMVPVLRESRMSDEDLFASSAYRSAQDAADYSGWPVVGLPGATNRRAGERATVAMLFRSAFLTDVARTWDGVASAAQTRSAVLSRVSAAEGDLCRSGANTVSVACVTGKQLGQWTSRTYVLCKAPVPMSTRQVADLKEDLVEINASMRAEPDLASIVSLNEALLSVWTEESTPPAAACEKLSEIIREASRS